MKRKEDGDRPAGCRRGLEPLQNELREGGGLFDLGLFIIRAANTDANVVAPLQHVEAAGRSACPERFLPQPRNFSRGNFLLSARGFAFLELFGRKHPSPYLRQFGRTRLVAFLSNLKADGI